MKLIKDKQDYEESIISKVRDEEKAAQNSI